jgi:pseudoazurin
MMLKTLVSGAAFAIVLGGAALAEMHEVQMLNKGEEGRMVFEPAFLQIANGDTVKFIAAKKGHNAESVKGMLPDGADAFKGRINEEIEVTFDVDGLYGVKCKPHYSMGMVMTVAVGDSVEVPAGYFDGRIPRKARERFESQLAEL